MRRNDYVGRGYFYTVVGSINDFPNNLLKIKGNKFDSFEGKVCICYKIL